MSTAVITLAFDLGDIIALTVGVIIVFGGGIARVLTEWAKKRRDALSPLPPSSQNMDASLAELSQRRRAQLSGEESVAPSAARTPSNDPQNMTMAERVERARAKAEYERRAREMAQTQRRSGPSAQQPELQQRIEERRLQREAQLRAQEQKETQRSMANRERVAQNNDDLRRRRINQERERQQREAHARQQAERARRAAEIQRQQQRAIAEAQAHARQQEQQQQRRRPRPSETTATSAGLAAAAGQPVAISPAASSGPALIAALHHPMSLRRAFVLKELLDSPVGLRDLR
jgi:dTMP kinase